MLPTSLSPVWSLSTSILPFWSICYSSITSFKPSVIYNVSSASEVGCPISKGVESPRLSKVQGATTMARDGLNLNSHLSRVASSVAEGRGGVLYCGFQVQLCSFNAQFTINGKILVGYPYASYSSLPCFVFVHFHPSFLVNLLFLNHLVQTISDLQCIICLKGWLSHFRRCGV